MRDFPLGSDFSVQTGDFEMGQGPFFLYLSSFLVVRRDLLFDQVTEHVKNVQLHLLNAGCLVGWNDNVDISQFSGNASLPPEQSNAEHFAFAR
jgi:hypothetical protein